MLLPRSIFGVLAGVLMGATMLQASAEADDGRSVAIPIGGQFATHDSLKKPAQASADAMDCLDGLCWDPVAFTVQCEQITRTGSNATIRFPSARISGHAQNDSVAMEWYAVTDENGRLVQAPAIVVVHESGRGMTVGRMVARGLRDRGIHGFMVQLPFYGLRRPPEIRTQDQEFAVLMGQGIADARRALDAVKILPGVDDEKISLQGTSLGGFIVATTAGLDDAFYRSFVLLAGGSLPDLVSAGKRETAELREMLQRQGFEGQKVFDLLNKFEPNRLAHRIDARRLWLYTATFDTVVPAASGDSFARAAGLDPAHHIRMPANHYSGVVFLPMVLDQIAVEAGGRAPVPGA